MCFIFSSFFLTGCVCVYFIVSTNTSKEKERVVVKDMKITSKWKIWLLY